jgi:ABC-type nitrate/sulfonate/bicarbonate transport system substrate-binding protein
MLNDIVIGGVPEHFNLPWRDAVAALQRTGERVAWREVPEGTGAMAAALGRGDLDIAVMLTEGAVAALGPAPAFGILAAYTTSPLLWGIHVPAASPWQTEDEIRGRRYAISRRGSGSHLMSFAHARSRGWPTEQLVFVEVGTLAGAIEAFRTGAADVFFWEKFMTKPLVDAGEFRRVGEFSAPWPAFVVCVRLACWRAARERIERIVTDVFQRAAEFRHSPQTVTRIEHSFGLTAADAAEWLALTHWADAIAIDADMLDATADVLLAAGAIQVKPSIVPLGRRAR